MVYRTNSDPGVIVNSAFDFSFLSTACCASEAAREISSYDELVHEPIKPTSILVGHPFSLATSAIFEIGVARSGVNGPLIYGSSSSRLISMS